MYFNSLIKEIKEINENGLNLLEKEGSQLSSFLIKCPSSCLKHLLQS